MTRARIDLHEVLGAMSRLAPEIALRCMRDATIQGPSPNTVSRGISRFAWPITLALLVSVTGCRRDVLTLDGSLLDGGPRDGASSDASLDLDELPLTLVRVLPDHGPFSGGNAVVLRGNGFRPGTYTVRFGDTVVPAGDVRRIDPNRLEVLVPARAPGAVDVSVDDGTSAVTLADAYVYDAVALSPTAGPPGGGTALTLRAASAVFTADTVVRLDGLPCTDWRASTPLEGVCRTPVHDLGVVDVSISAGDETWILEDAFTYENPFRAFGGLGGGPLDGTLTVLVRGFDGAPLAGARVLVGRDGAYPYAAITGPTGTVTFEGADLRGRVDVFASHPCHHHTGFVGIDAAVVTAGMRLALLDCLSGGGGGAPPPSDAQIEVSGELVFYGGLEFLEPTFEWVGVPEPAPGQERVIYVGFAGGRDLLNGNGISAFVSPFVRVTDATRGERGYPFRVVERAGAATFVAVALAGLESGGGACERGPCAPGGFVPYVAGLSRPFVLPPSRTATGVEVPLDSPLEPGRTVAVQTPTLPMVTVEDPSRGFSPGAIDTLDLFVRYAAPGVAAGLPLFGLQFGGDDLSGPLGERTITLQPSARGSFGSAEQELFAILRPSSGFGQWYEQPHTRVSVRAPLGAERVALAASQFLPLPTFTAPATTGAPLPADRTLRWAHEGDHTLYRLRASRPLSLGFSLVWYVLAHPSVRAVTFPEESDGFGGLPSGTVKLTVEALDIPALDFDRIDTRVVDSFSPRRSAANVLAAEVR